MLSILAAIQLGVFFVYLYPLFKYTRNLFNANLTFYKIAIKIRHVFYPCDMLVTVVTLVTLLVLNVCR